MDSLKDTLYQTLRTIRCVVCLSVIHKINYMGLSSVNKTFQIY